MGGLIRGLKEIAEAGPQELAFVRALVETYADKAHEKWVETVRDCLRLQEVDGDVRRAEAAAQAALTEWHVARRIWQPGREDG